MSKPPKAKNDYVSIARQYRALHPYFAKIATRKRLSKAEKTKITRLVNKLHTVEHEFGAGGYAILKTEKQKKAAEKSGLKLGEFNLIKLNSYINEKAPLKVSSDGEVIIQKAKHRYNSHVREWHFHKVNYSYKFFRGDAEEKEEKRDEQDGQIVKKFRAELDRAKAEISKARKGSKNHELAFYLWGPKGIMYKKQAGSPDLLLKLVQDWLNQYVPEDPKERRKRGLEHPEQVLIGFAWHRNVGYFPNAPKRKAGSVRRKSGRKSRRVRK